MQEVFSISDKLTTFIEDLFRRWGFTTDFANKADGWIFVLILIILSFLLSWLLKFIIHRISIVILKRRKATVLKTLAQNNIFARLIYVLPPILILSFLPLIYDDDYPKFIKFLERICWIYFVISFSIYINYILGVVWKILEAKEHTKNIPMHGLLQLFRGIVITLMLIIVVSIIINKSPINLITGLGAFAAVLMLVFKDTILGLVAGVQLSQNDVLRKGDWITADNEKVNGIVLDITLNTVKVRNFDHTIVTIPPYSLISEPMQNWRAMQQSGGRRIRVAVMIEASTIKPLSDEQLDDIKRVDILKDYIIQKEKDREEGIEMNTNNSKGLVNGTIDTNLGLFRAYVQLYAESHSLINKTLMCMVRLLPPADNGVPLELYCFTSITEWKAYESVKSEITEHICSSAPMFGLRIFQNASGYHYIAPAYITTGKNLPKEY